MPMGACTVTTSRTLTPQKASREGGAFTHFISLECSPDSEWGYFKKKVIALQDDVSQVANILFRGIEATKEKKERFKASSSGANLSPINREMATLRERNRPPDRAKATPYPSSTRNRSKESGRKG